MRIEQDGWFSASTMAFSTTMADNSLHKSKNLPEDIWVSQSNHDTSNDTNNVAEEAVFLELVRLHCMRNVLSCNAALLWCSTLFHCCCRTFKLLLETSRAGVLLAHSSLQSFHCQPILHGELSGLFVSFVSWSISADQQTLVDTSNGINRGPRPIRTALVKATLPTLL